MKSIVLKTISENPYKEKVYGMWIIQYFDDSNKHMSVKVICGEKKEKGGGDIWYNAKGMNVKDFQTLKPHYQEFLAFSNNPPAFPTPGETAPSDGAEEVPW